MRASAKKQLHKCSPHHPIITQRFQSLTPSFTKWPHHIGWCFRLWSRCGWWCPQHVLLLSLLAAENQTQEDSPKRRTDGNTGCAAAPNRDIYHLKLLQRVVPHPQLSAASLPRTTPQVLEVRVLLHSECIWTKSVPVFGNRDLCHLPHCSVSSFLQPDKKKTRVEKTTNVILKQHRAGFLFPYCTSAVCGEVILFFFMGPHSYSFWGCNKRAVRVGPWQKIEFLFNTKKVFDFPQTEGDFHSYLALAGEAQGERDMHCPGYYSLLVTKVCVISDGTGIKIPLKLIFLGCITKCV